MMRNPFLVFLLGLAFIMSACKQAPQPGAEVIAIFDDKVLIREELDAFIPATLFLNDSTKAEDSVFFAEKFISQWIKDQIIEEAANKSIKDFSKRIDYQVESYRRKLVHHEYAKWVVNNRLDTLVKEEEIANFFTQNPDKFISRSSYYSYFHVRTEKSNQYKQMYWMRSTDPAELDLLRAWCEEEGNCVKQKIDSVYVSDHELRVDGEGYFADITRLKVGLPYSYYTKKEKTYHNFIKMIDVIKPGDPKPLVLCKEEIVEIILRERKNALIKQIEDDLFLKAQQNDRFIIMEE